MNQIINLPGLVAAMDNMYFYKNIRSLAGPDLESFPTVDNCSVALKNLLEPACC